MGLEQKKIIIVFNSLNIGGIETKIIDICRYYSKSKKTVVFLLLKNKTGELLPFLPKNIKIKTPLIKIKKIKTILFPFWLSWQYLQIKPDLVITFGNFSSISGILAKIFSRSKTKLIISEDSSITDQIEMEKFSFIRYMLLKITYPLADKIIVLTEVGKVKLEKLIPKFKSKILVISNWLPLRFSSENKINNNKRDIDILFLGRLEPQKNPQKFVEVINYLTKELPYLKAVIVGNGSLKNKIQKYIKKNNLQKNIIIKPATTNVFNYYQKSKIFLLTSAHEGFPLTILEASAAGAIPVCINIPEIETYFEYQPELLLFQSPKAAYKNILFLIENPKISLKTSNFYQKLAFENQKIFFHKTIKEFQKLL